MQDRTLWHYTDMSGFLGIIENKRLWLTSGRHLNDHAEGRWLDPRPRELPTGPNAHVERLFVELFSMMRTSPDVFVTSFSENEDQLSQWRSYSADASGVSIGFSEDVLIDSCTTTHDDLELQPVVYGDRSAEAEALAAEFAGIGGLEVETGYHQRMLELMWTTKNPAFSEESEKRLLYLPSLGGGPDCLSELQHRIARGVDLVSYYELSFPPEAIRYLMLGPKCRVEEGTLNLFLRHNSFHHVEPEDSRATYR